MSAILLGVVLTTRGLICAHTLRSLWAALQDYEHYLAVIIGEPIPDAFNLGVAECLEYAPGLTHILMVEEDNVLPAFGVSELLRLDADVALFDYPRHGLNPWVESDEPRLMDGLVYRNREGKLLFGPLGAALIRESVFARVGKPWFRAATYRLEGDELIFVELRESGAGQEVDFCHRAIQAGCIVRAHPRLSAGHVDVKADPPMFRRSYTETGIALAVRYLPVPADA